MVIANPTAAARLESRTEVVSHTLDLLIRRDAETLVLRNHVDSLVGGHIDSQSLVNDLVVVIDEALTNVFLHSLADAGPHAQAQVQLQLHQMTGALCRVSVTITDRGQGGITFNPFQVCQAPHSAEDDPDAALGIRVILRVMDEVSYDVSTTGANRLCMQKYVLSQTPETGYSVRLGAFLVQQRILSPDDLAAHLEDWQQSPFDDLGEWLLASRRDPLDSRMRQAIVHARQMVEMLGRTEVP